MKKKFFAAVVVVLCVSSPSSAFFGKGEQQTTSTPYLDVLQDAPDVFRILSGSTMKVVLDTQLSTENAAIGDAVNGHLAEPIEYGGTLLIPKGTMVIGRVSAVDGPKRQLKADVSTHHWLNAQAGMDIDFYEMKLPNGAVLQIHGMPAINTVVQTSNANSPKLRVDKDGDITVDFHQGRDAALGFGIGAAALATGPIGLLLAPAAGAAIGAAHPSYGLDRPTTDQDSHPRWHGMLMGALGGVPGGFLAKDAIDKGADVVLTPGDELTIQLNSDLSIKR